jgi:hypothetical protein
MPKMKMLENEKAGVESDLPISGLNTKLKKPCR